MSDTPPHAYKDQRKFEREAAAAREILLFEGAKLPPICGFTYVTRAPRSQAKTFKPEQVQCQRAAGANTRHHGRGYCDYHDWQANQEYDRLSEKSDLHKAKVLAMRNAKFFGEATPTDPHTAILDEIARTAGIVKWLEQRMAELREAGVDDLSIIGQLILKEGIQPSIWMTLFQDERRHLVQVCAVAIKAGIAERKVRIAEEQGRLLAAVLQAFMHDAELGLSQDQMLRAPAIIRRHLLALPSAEPHQALGILNVKAQEVEQ